MLTLAHRLMLGAASRPKPPVGLVAITSSGAVSDVGRAAAVDSAGNRIVVGYAGSPRIVFVAKFDKDGILLWQRKLALAVQILVNACAVNAGGDIFIGGFGYASGSVNSGYIAKYNASGLLQWQRKLTTTVSTLVQSMALDSAGNVYAVGPIQGAKGTVLLVKYSTGGAIQWQRVVSHASNSLSAPNGLTVDSSGNLYWAVEQVITSSSDTWGLVVKCSSTGTVSQVIARRTDAYANPMWGTAVDSSGNIYACGSSNSSGSARKPYLAKYNSSGVLQWWRYLSGDSTLLYLCAVTLSSDEVHVYAAGNQYLCKFLAADGSLVWQRSLSGPTTVSAGFQMAHNSGYVHATSGLFGMPGTDSDALTAKLPDDGSGLGTYGSVIVYSEPTLTSNTGSPTSATPTITDTAGTHTEAAGDMTDAAGSLTVTPYL